MPQYMDREWRSVPRKKRIPMKSHDAQRSDTVITSNTKAKTYDPLTVKTLFQTQGLEKSPSRTSVKTTLLGDIVSSDGSWIRGYSKRISTPPVYMPQVAADDETTIFSSFTHGNLCTESMSERPFSGPHNRSQQVSVHSISEMDEEDPSHRIRFPNVSDESLSAESVRLVEGYLDAHRSLLSIPASTPNYSTGSRGRVDYALSPRAGVVAGTQEGGEAIYEDTGEMRAPKIHPSVTTQSVSGAPLSRSDSRENVASNQGSIAARTRPGTPNTSTIDIVNSHQPQEDDDTGFVIVGNSVRKLSREASYDNTVIPPRNVTVVENNSVVTIDGELSASTSQPHISSLCRQIDMRIPAPAPCHVSTCDESSVADSLSIHPDLGVPKDTLSDGLANTFNLMSPTAGTENDFVRESITSSVYITDNTHNILNSYKYPDGVKILPPKQPNRRTSRPVKQSVVHVVVPKLEVRWEKAQKEQQHRIRNYCAIPNRRLDVRRVRDMDDIDHRSPLASTRDKEHVSPIPTTRDSWREVVLKDNIDTDRSAVLTSIRPLDEYKTNTGDDLHASQVDSMSRRPHRPGSFQNHSVKTDSDDIVLTPKLDSRHGKNGSAVLPLITVLPNPKR
mmetsp:Transcript_9934/g.14972  ORF Transcript_9934/g.14972 Transcript_9934/m.14972 type:complete len:617 (-) Transcript_9934:133-1983(-)